MLPQNQKLKKLTIKAYTTSMRSGSPVGVFEAMYNPTSFSQKYELSYSKNQAFDSSGVSAKYARSKPREISMKLVLDGSGVNNISLTTLFNTKPVTQLVKEFVDLTYTMNGQIHEPNYLVVEWGGQDNGGLGFSCRLQRLDVNYSSFNRDGSPIRAELDITLISDDDVKKRVKMENKASPDLTHTRIVRRGDTLPLLTKEVYGTSIYYLGVAQFNRLNNFRQLTIGQKLSFPPLDNQPAEKK